MNRKQILERMKELEEINKEFELLFPNDQDEELTLLDITGAIEEAIFFYNDKLKELTNRAS